MRGGKNMNLFEHRISTREAQQMAKVTDMIRQDVAKSGIREGIVVVYSPHTTAGFPINENADPDVVHDMLYGLQEAFPTRTGYYQHMEGNSHAHIKTSFMGPSNSQKYTSCQIPSTSSPSCRINVWDGPIKLVLICA